MKINAEGDVQVSDDSVEGLGTHRFSTTFFGVLMGLVKLPESKIPSSTSPTPITIAEATQTIADSQPHSFPWNPGDKHLEQPKILQLPMPVADPLEIRKTGMLTDLFPDPGYFLAGGAAGVVSRTATAPLDRLKVYLIAQTGVKDEAAHAAKSGAPIQAAKKVARPLIEAIKALWRMGGIRSLFAGKLLAVGGIESRLIQ